MTEYYLGLDLGQSRDHTAIAVLERAERRGAFDPVMYAYRKVVTLDVRYLERVPLGTPYTEVVNRIVRDAPGFQQTLKFSGRHGLFQLNPLFLLQSQAHLPVTVHDHVL